MAGGMAARGPSEDGPSERGTGEPVTGVPAMLDAGKFIDLNERLRAARLQVEAADVTNELRGRWQRQLIAISDGAVADLASADEQLTRLEAELTRRHQR